MKRQIQFYLHSILFLVFSTLADAKPFVTIDSLTGIVELQRSGTIYWSNVSKESKLYDNDLLRVPGNGLAMLRWPNGTQTYVHKTSQIMITLFQKKNDKGILANATIMFGAAFFIVKKMLPKDKSEEMRVYTPTAVLSIRGTSFLVDVDSTRAITTVKMLNGLVMVKNVTKNISVLLGTPYQTVIEKNLNPSTPKAVLQNDIDSMKQWLPVPVIENEIAKQIDNSKQDRMDLASDYQEKCLVTHFVNASGYNGPWNIEQEITRQFSTLLRKNLARVVVMMTDSVVSDPVETAKSLDARFCISGKIDQFELSKHAEISAMADEYRESVIAKTGFEVKLFDMSQNKEIVNELLVSESVGKNILENTWDVFNKKAFNLSDSTFVKTIMGSATQASINKSIKTIIKKIQE
jgi:hypothetical protein